MANKDAELISDDQFEFLTEDKIDRRDIVQAIVVEKEMELKEADSRLKGELDATTEHIRTLDAKYRQDMDKWLKSKQTAESKKIKKHMVAVGMPAYELRLSVKHIDKGEALLSRRVIVGSSADVALVGDITATLTARLVSQSEKLEEARAQKERITEEIHRIRTALSNIGDYERAMNAKLTREVLKTNKKGKQLFNALAGSVTGQKLIES